jgi:putative pyrroloquinoline-quinone binding quinoprotein
VRARLAALAALVVLTSTLAGATKAAEPPGWTTYGADPGRTGATAEAIVPGGVEPDFVLPIQGRVTSQVLAARDVPVPGSTTLYVATTAGRIYAVSETGFVRWRVELGQLPNACAQLDGYGVVGTPVIDPATRTLYAADGLGRLHALDLATGVEREGWPVMLFSDPDQELVWGAIAFAHGSVYAATGSYCDGGPFEGHVIRVDTETKATTTWTAVPAELGGGGGIWGWGGIAYSSALERLFVVTGNAFSGGTNTDDSFSEAAGYGEALVEFSPDLEVTGASHPASIDKPLDLDFVGSPVVFDRPDCGELAVAQDKNAQLFGWRAGAVAGGPVWTVDLETFDPDNPVLSQPAFDPFRSAVFTATGTRLARVDVAPDCSATTAWALDLGTDSLNGSPTIAGDTVWLTVSGTPALVGVNADTGRKVATLPLPGLSIVAPTVIDGRIFVPTFTGQLVGFTSPSAKAVQALASVTGVPGHTSRLDARHRWESRETGVYSTDDGGRHWQRIFPTPASAVLRTSMKVGLIRVAKVAPGCVCTRTFWTKDGGKHWTRTRAIAGGLTGRGGLLYWLAAGDTQLRQVTQWPPVGGISSTLVFTASSGRIVSRALVPGGISVLVRNPTTGQNYLRIVRGDDVDTVDLPQPPGTIVAASLTGSGAEVTVRATVFADGQTEALRWSNVGSSTAWTPDTN